MGGCAEPPQLGLFDSCLLGVLVLWLWVVCGWVVGCFVVVFLFLYFFGLVCGVWCLVGGCFVPGMFCGGYKGYFCYIYIDSRGSRGLCLYGCLGVVALGNPSKH